MHVMKAASCIFLAALAAGCSESITNPLTPGSGLVRNDVIIRDTTVVATGDSVFLLRVSPDSILLAPTQRNLLGKFDNYTALAAIRFYPTARDTISVLSAKLTLRMISRYGPSSGLFALNVHKILTDWDQRRLTWETANGSGFYESAVVRGRYSSTNNPDTQLVTIDLDTAMVREWYRSGQTSYGIMLVPGAASTVMRGFHAFDYDSTKFWPKLEVIATDANRTGRFLDTTSLQIGADSYVANADPFPLHPERIYTQAGVFYRSILKFDVSALPRGAVITAAELLLEKDASLSKLQPFSPDPTPVVHAIARLDTLAFESLFSSGALKGSSTTTYAFNVRRQVQVWVNGFNRGLLLRQNLSNEINTLDLFVFYGSRSSDPTKRPRINITYTVFKN